MPKERSGRTGFQEAMYREHRKNMKDAVAKVDCAPPKLVAGHYVSNGVLSSAQRRLDEVERQNRALLQAINRIYRTQGGTECHNNMTFKTSNYRERLIRNLYTQKSNDILLGMLKRAGSKYKKQEQLIEFGKGQKEMIKSSRYPEFYETDLIDPLEKWTICPEDNDEKPEKITSIPSKRVKCYFDLEITGERKLGRMWIEIYKDYVPIAGENFLQFMKGESGVGYKNSIIYRIKPRFGFLGGDVENRNGASTITAYGRPFAHENHLLKFAGPGVVAAFTLIPGLNFCQFFVSFKALPFLQNQFVVIGRVIKNLRTLEMVEEFGSGSGVPKKPIVIQNCGIWQGKV